MKKLVVLIKKTRIYEGEPPQKKLGKPKNSKTDVYYE